MEYTDLLEKEQSIGIHSKILSKTVLIAETQVMKLETVIIIKTKILVKTNAIIGSVTQICKLDTEDCIVKILIL